MQITDELKVLVEAEVARAVENFKKLSEGVEDSEKKTNSLGEALDSLSSKSLIVSGVLGGAGIAAVKFAGENEKLKLSLKNMLGSAQDVEAVFKDWRDLGTSPGLSVDEVFSVGRALVNLGNDTEYATKTIEMLGNIAAGTGVSFGEISSSFERARAMGNLTTRDLVRLQQQGIPIVQQLAKDLGTSEDNIKKLAAEGKISFSDLERSFRAMSAPGGQFAGMMDELSGTTLETFNNAVADAKFALASFGEVMLPIATDMLNVARDIFQGFADMDDGTKRFVLGMGGVIAISGPAISAIKGISSALIFMASNPYVLAIGGTVAAVGAIAGLVNKQAHAYEDLHKKIRETDTASRSLLSAYSAGNNAKLLDEKTTRELIKLYPELNGVIKAHTTTVEEAAAATKELARAQEFQAYQKELAKINDEITRLERNRAGLHRNALEGLEERYARQKELIDKIFNFNKKPIIVDIEVAVEEPEFKEAAQLKKRWQEWFGEIAKIDPEMIVGKGDKSAGIVAAELYIADFERGLNAQKTIAEVLGEELDLAGILKSKQDDIHKTLVELLSIDPKDIDLPFEVIDESVQELIREYKRLGEEAAELNKTLSETSDIVNELALSFEDFLTKTVADKLQNIFPELEEQAAQAIANINTQLAMMSFDGMLNGLSAIGEAWAKNENAAEGFAQAMGQMAQQIVNQLPLLFLQAGLQLIAQGQWPMGLGFIAAAGSSAIISGYVKGTIEKETANAHGNAFDHGAIAAFAHGGSFTNQIVAQPTHFRYGGKLGLMGEAGPEAIMPLKRMPSGNLGVEAGGAGSNVTVTIINNTGASVKQEETQDENGDRHLKIEFGEIINGHLSSGKADRVLSGRYNLRAQGV